MTEKFDDHMTLEAIHRRAFPKGYFKTLDQEDTEWLLETLERLTTASNFSVNSIQLQAEGGGVWACRTCRAKMYHKHDCPGGYFP